jgi:hypothetical protein
MKRELTNERPLTLSRSQGQGEGPPRHPQRRRCPLDPKPDLRLERLLVAERLIVFEGQTNPSLSQRA